MNCELAQERMVTAAYGELADEQAHELEQHVAGCAACQKEREQVFALKVLAGLHPVLEPGPNLIARSRLRLDEALDALPPKRWYERLGERILANFASLQAAPAAALLLLIAGAGAGVLGGYEFAQGRTAAAATAARAALPIGAQVQPAASTPELANVAGISSIVRQPNSEMVSVSYNQVVPRQVEGSLDDPSIRQLLMLASENAASPAVRDDSVALLAAECRAGHSCQPSGIRDALMVALRYDKSAKVRQKALEGLEPYVAEDIRVRDAVLESLLNDNDAGVRAEAIGLLTPVEADTSVQQVLYSVSNSDRDSQIRNVSRQVLSRVQEIQ
ncbi:MAG: zf-HC2 domain-containing protein [Terracidiphilus sp.]